MWKTQKKKSRSVIRTPVLLLKQMNAPAGTLLCFGHQDSTECTDNKGVQTSGIQYLPLLLAGPTTERALRSCHNLELRIQLSIGDP